MCAALLVVINQCSGCCSLVLSVVLTCVGFPLDASVLFRNACNFGCVLSCSHGAPWLEFLYLSAAIVLPSYHLSHDLITTAFAFMSNFLPVSPKFTVIPFFDFDYVFSLYCIFILWCDYPNSLLSLESHEWLLARINFD